MPVEKRAVVGLAHPYHNPHLSELVRLAALANGWCLDYIAFAELPIFRAGNDWDRALPNQAPMRTFRGWLALLGWLVRCESYVFWGLAHPFPTQTLAIFAACLSGRPVYLASEGFKNPPSFALRLLLRFLSVFGNAQLLAIGNTAASEFRGAGLAWPARIFAFAEDPPGLALPSRPKALGKPVRLLVVGQLIPRKRVDWLIDHLASHPDRDRLELHVCGIGPELANLEKKAANSALRVCFKGFRKGSELADEFNTADIFVHPALYEGWGVVLNHALYFGLPILAYSRVRSARGLLVLENLNGFVFDDERDFASQLGILIHDSVLRARFGAHSRKISAEWTVKSIGSLLGLVLADPDLSLPQGNLLSILD